MPDQPRAAAIVVYVSNAESSDIHVLALDRRNGDLTLVETVDAPDVVTAGSAMPLAVSPDRRFLYAALRGEPLAAVSFAIDPTSGRLKHVATAPLPDSMPYIATDRSGRFLLSASYSGDKIAINPIEPGGVVRAATQVVPTAPNAHAILADPENRHVLVPCLGGDIVMQMRFDAATGALSPNAPPAMDVKKGAGPRHLVFHPSGRRVYLVNELDGSLNVLDYDAASGQLARLQTINALPPGFAGKPWAADIRISPDGRFVYASERTSSTLAMFRVDQDSGALTHHGHVKTEEQPRSFCIDPSGRYLFVVGELSHALASYAIDANSGALTALKRYPVGKRPNWVEAVALG